MSDAKQATTREPGETDGRNGYGKDIPGETFADNMEDRGRRNTEALLNGKPVPGLSASAAGGICPETFFEDLEEARAEIKKFAHERLKKLSERLPKGVNIGFSLSWGSRAGRVNETQIIVDHPLESGSDRNVITDAPLRHDAAGNVAPRTSDGNRNSAGELIGNFKDGEAIKCKACGKDIVFLLTTKGHRMPVDAETATPGEALYNKDIHTSHFESCTEADRFRKKGGHG